MMLRVSGPPEVLSRVELMAREGNLELHISGVTVDLLPADDDTVMAEASQLLPRYLHGDSTLTTVQYWLRGAAETAWRRRNGRD